MTTTDAHLENRVRTQEHGSAHGAVATAPRPRRADASDARRPAMAPAEAITRVNGTSSGLACRLRPRHSLPVPPLTLGHYDG
jgi:hypothetical protein